jgi:hypothetical protein
MNIEYRIEYSIGEDHAEVNSYHYYMADSPIQALAFHCKMAKIKELKMQNISVERYCKYSNKWINESKVLERESSLNDV